MSNNNIWDDTEESWLCLIKQGNQQAFGRLYDKYAPMLMGIIMRLVTDKSTAEDVLLRVFNNIWDNRTMPGFSQERVFSTMLKFARNTAREIVQNQKTKFGGELQETNKTDVLYQFGNILDQQIDTKRPALPYNMEKTSKEALDLVFFKGYSFSDAAALLNIPVDNLKDKLRIAIKQLKRVAMS